MAQNPDNSHNDSPGSILSDVQILERLVQDDPTCIFISPLIDPTAQVGPSSIDVRLGEELKVPNVISSTHIDLTGSRSALKGQLDHYFRIEKPGAFGEFVLHPGEFALGATLEFIRLPNDIAGRLEGRSSLGRLGIEVHSTAGFIDPGFEGTLTFELSNVGKLPVKIYPGLRIAQLCFFPVNEVQNPYAAKPNSKYGGMLNAETSRIYDDPEIRQE